MARVVYLDPIDHISGKISRKHRTVYCYLTSTGAKYTQLYTKPAGSPTAAQLVCTSKFRQAAQQTNTIMADISQLETYRTQWRTHIQGTHPRYRTLRGFIFAQVYRTL
jgi:hypothetical protein